MRHNDFLKVAFISASAGYDIPSSFLASAQVEATF